MRTITLPTGRKIGPGEPCFLVAEVGMNHNGDLDLAKAMIDAAKESGSDAVKFQMSDATAFVHSSVLSRELDANGNPLPKQASLQAMEFTLDQWAALRDHGEAIGIPVFVTPLDLRSADWVGELSLPLVKIASGDTDFLPLIRRCATLGVPTILSTGMTTLEEADVAVEAFREAGGEDLIVLQCASAYPADPADSNVAVIPQLMARYGLPSGLSDHCAGNSAAFAAVALGASVVEKHFTTDRALPGVDQAMSLDPVDFTALVTTCREIEAARGTGEKGVLEKERPVLAVARRSLFTSRALQSGTVLTEDMLVAMRPAGGVAVADWDSVIGRTVTRDLTAGEKLMPDDLG